MSAVWIVVDVGCFECGVSTEAVGMFKTPEKAEAAADARDGETSNWRDGGRSRSMVFGFNTMSGEVVQAHASSSNASPSSAVLPKGDTQ